MNRRQRKKHPFRFLGYMPDASTTPWARMWCARAWGHIHIRRERAAERRRERIRAACRFIAFALAEWTEGTAELLARPFSTSIDEA